MKALGTGLLIALGFIAGTVGAQSSNWIIDILAIRSFQTDVVRHPARKSDVYYLCWQEEGQKFGLVINRRSMNNQMRSLKPGERTPLYMLTSSGGLQDYTAQAAEICWG